MARSNRNPYINFEFDTATVKPAIWMNLGEAMSKCQHLAGVPLKPGRADELASVYLARGVQATTAIEGNTLTDHEVQQIVKAGHAEVGKSREYLQREVQNVLAAIRDIDRALREGQRLPITRERLEKLNSQILDGIPDEPEVVPGMVRQHDVRAGSYRAPDWQDVPGLLDEFVSWLSQLREVPEDASVQDRFVSAMLSAVLAHLYIAWIHPFGNGNGRLARLIEVQILSESGVVPIIATNLLSDFYNKTRFGGYYRALDAAQHDVKNFIQYALEGFLDEVRAQIEVVKAENVQIHWESYVHEVFQEMPSTDTRTRQRALALALPPEWITPKAATELTPRLAAMYAKVGERAPTRDLNDLEKMGIVSKEKRQYRVRRDVIEAFIPPIWEPPHKPTLDEALADHAPSSDPTLFDDGVPY